jgi:hypothetical protein
VWSDPTDLSSTLPADSSARSPNAPRGFGQGWHFERKVIDRVDAEARLA